MVMKLRIYCFLIFYLSFTHSVFSEYTVNKTYKLDLSNSAILCMFQDNKGYMWLGTYDGLNLYNSKNTFVYRFELDDDSTLASNIIHKITQADDDHLWVSTFLGLNKFSLKKRKVVESYHEYPEARLLDTDKYGNTWTVTKRNYISYYTPESKRFVDIHFPGADTENVLELFTDNDSKVNLVMKDGTIRQSKISSSNNGVNRGFTLNIEELIFHNKQVTYASSQKGSFYFVDVDMSLYFYNRETKEKKYLANLKHLIPVQASIASIVTFHDDIFVLLKSAGIIKLNSRKQYKPEKINTNLSVFCALKDNNQDLLWIGTDGQGVKLYYQNHDMFKNMPTSDLSLQNQKPIRAIYADEFNTLWVGTKGDGFVQIKNYNNPKERFFSKFTTSNGLANNYVFSFTKSNYRDIVWIGTEGTGLSFYSYNDNKVRTIPNPRIGKVHKICEIDSSTLWLATAGFGLMEVKIKDKKGNLFIETVDEFLLKKNNRTCNEFHAMIYDGKSTLFVGSRGGYGIAKFDIKSKKYEFIQMSKRENSAIGDILSLHYSKDSVFYIGASSGLTKMQLLDNDRVVIKQYDKRSGIANDMIHGILEDDKGFIWLSTNKGLTKFNPKNDSFHNYASPELLITEFSDDAYWTDIKNNRLFFGGINGLVWIDPDQDLLLNTYRSDFRFFDLRISGERRCWEDFLTKKGNLELPANTTNFSISFVSMDYINGENYEYSYILENYNDIWVELQKNNEVTFSNLPYGDYTLRVRCKSDVVGIYKDELVLHITKLAPWYLCTWAIILYILLFILLCIYLIYYLNKRVTDRQNRITKQIEEEAKVNLLGAKLDFFTNITHELCTPLTVINGITEYFEKVDQEDNHSFREYTEVLKQNVNSLNELIQEILDFRKIEGAKLEANNIVSVNITKLLPQHLKSFQSIAEQNTITLNTNIGEGIEWNTDIVCFNRIFLNLISNAFKFNKENGIVKVSVCIEDNNLILKVYNTGKGIDESQKAHIFDHYCVLNNMESNNQYSKMSSQHGIGLYLCQSMATQLGGKIEVNSVINQYAEFVLTLPQLRVTQEVLEKSLDITKQHLDTDTEEGNNNEVKHSVLVIDDNQDIVWYLKEILKGEYNVICVNSAEEALASIKTQSPSLIITDIMMPNIDGLELIGRIKENKFTKYIPLIILSAKISDREQAEGIQVGADAYLTKPFSPIILQATIKRLLTNKHELKDYYYSPESAYKYTDGQLVHQVDKDFIDEVVSIIDNNIENENLGPEFIAEKLDINTRNLYRKFKKVTDLSPSDFIKDYRFNLAAKLLVTTDLTVLEIIYKVGITNKSYFYREFLKKYNKTPREYRLKIV